MRSCNAGGPLRLWFARRAYGALGRRSVALGALILTAACADEPGAVPGEAAVPAISFEIEAEPALSVGVQTGDTLREFDRVVSPFVLSDGRLVVPLAGSSDIRVFSQDGSFVERLGRRGEGPGEFMYLSGAWPRGDSIEAFDSRLRRITRFVPDGPVEVVAIPSGTYPDMSVPVGPFGAGWALGGVVGRRGQRDSIVVHHFHRDGAHLGELGSVDGMARYFAAGAGSPEPLSPRSVAASDGTHLYLGDTQVPSIRRIGSRGMVAGQISWQPVESMSGEAALGQVIDAAVSTGSVDRGFFNRERLKAAPVPAALSVFWDFLPDPEGFLWIQPYEPLRHALALGATPAGRAGGGREWGVFTTAGRYAGSVEIPDGLAVTQVTRAAVVGIRRDELGVETVHVHRVTR